MAVTLSSFLPPQGEFRHRIAFMMQQFAADTDSLDDDDLSVPEEDILDNDAQYIGEGEDFLGEDAQVEPCTVVDEENEEQE